MDTGKLFFHICAIGILVATAIKECAAVVQEAFFDNGTIETQILLLWLKFQNKTEEHTGSESTNCRSQGERRATISSRFCSTRWRQTLR